MIHWIWQGFSTYILHSQHGNGYQWGSSGPGPLWLLQVLAYGTVAHHFIVRHNCHHKRCLSIHTHRHPEHGWPACKTHWDEIPDHIKERET